MHQDTKVKLQLELLKSAADVSDWGYGRWAYETWERFDRDYFDSSLEPGGIYWGLTPHGGSLGYFERWRNSITLHTSLIKPSTQNPWGIGHKIGSRMAEDVLLHEMMHQAIEQRGGDERSPSVHNTLLWCAEINRLIPLLGIETNLSAKPVKQKRVKEPGASGKGYPTWVVEDGCLSRQQLATFPQCLRSPDRYQLVSN
jgi:hypothetical protein